MRIRWERLSAAASGALSVAGFGFLSAAAWTVGRPFGLAAVGVSLLLVDFMAERAK
jgi:hypothetical protein